MIHETGETGGRRARIRAERADEIVAAAWEIVRSEGMESLTTHALAARLELAVGALYRYFPSKAALVAELERRALVALGEALTEALERAEGSLRGAGAPLARLCLLGLTYGRFARERTAEFALLGQMLANPRVLLVGAEGAGPTAAALGVLDVAARAFAQAAEAGALPPGDALERAALYGAGLRGALELGKLRAHDARVDGPTLADAMSRALLAGFGAEPAALTRAFAAALRHDERAATEAAR